ncbi:hypothetical protein A3A79_02670 [Candidatus Gottesmanbacteria bacterium RIFCSPLOWO2_01_FULL_43_11b]|uniref:Bacterial sugar transferase domain-containing protein n=1 Tax=Candidatus Gottesmanbacteria bacterium RIFCSPLOWO2_01_FULL_43_11b TaxID=1798392 RepID=A0A1F6AHJ1_9BACT|nr:MAG: hypothetical protein A3A79_02670 [Candidatus Gottesmanbacteria bacterium RIFCSPLOWO2_01_FULL_43_11b]
MALIGPRPLPVAEAKKLKPWMQKRHAVLPGIISPAILTGSYHSDFDAWMKSDVAYLKEKSVGYDLYIVGRTLLFLLRLLAREIGVMV